MKGDVQINIPMDPEVARVLRVWAAYQDKTRSQFIRKLLWGVAQAIQDIGVGVGTIEVQATREIEK